MMYRWRRPKDTQGFPLTPPAESTSTSDTSHLGASPQTPALAGRRVLHIGVQNSYDGFALRAGLAVKGGAVLASPRFALALDSINL